MRVWLVASLLALPLVSPVWGQTQTSGTVLLEPDKGQNPPNDVLEENESVDIAVSIASESQIDGAFVDATVVGTTTVILGCDDSSCSNVELAALTFDSCTPEPGVTCAPDPGNANHILIAPPPGGLTATTAGTLFATITAHATPGEQVRNPPSGLFYIFGETTPGGLSTTAATGEASGNAELYYPGVCGDGVLDPGLGEQCDDGNTTSGDGCEADCQFPSCRITAGGLTTTGDTNPSSNASIGKAQFAGQVGASCGCIGCIDEVGHIQGFWTHSRRTKKGSLLAKRYNSLACGCDGVINGGTCPEPGHSNTACFTGIGSYSANSGRRGSTTVAFRVDAIDRGEPGRQDTYRMRIWVPQVGETAAGLADAACCRNAAPTIRTPDVDDGGSLLAGNVKVHPQTASKTDAPCPAPEESCPQ